jgi:HSP20 family molecular chaperone IbpA
MAVGNISSNTNSVNTSAQRQRVSGGNEFPQLIQAMRAKQAFERTVKLNENKELLPQGFNEEDIKLSISSQNITLKQTVQETQETKKEKEDEFFIQNKNYVGEIKNFINKNNYEVVEEEDIYNAISNGRSILADVKA